MSTAYTVRLVSVANENDLVRFKVTPTFTENRSVDYAAVAPIHMPGAIQVYKNSGSRTFSIGAQLVSRTGAEAKENMTYLQKLRGWTLPHFGQSDLTADQLESRQRLNKETERKAASTMSREEVNARNRQRLQSEGYDFLGAPPMVLYLYAYSTNANNTRANVTEGKVNINRVPVVITGLSITYPKEVDYISADPIGSTNKHTEPFPVLMEVGVELVETHSPREYERFKLADFYSGKLANF